MTDVDILERVIYTLDHVKVDGKSNLNMLLASIQELEKLKESIAARQEVK